ncbi:MAG: 50S ribosomal protein L29 [SAR86 cluster bacterium]|uniref:Large ribosomal subunit protein uL29 n=1 Tax=SAR86 cluster bacterium TaxID=2030880 RepID=A0A2A4MHF2_9GAMM|nr:MAG: 50S ribosomal protein L29 [SAR86 cluster bacterium]
MKASELRDSTVAELQGQLEQLFKDRFNFRMQKSTGQLAQSHLLINVKRDIARVKTIITEKQRSGT